jgi:hypothetical protein
MKFNKTAEKIREKGRKFLEELIEKGPNLDNVGKTIVTLSDANNDLHDTDEPLSEARKFRKLKIDINKEFGNKID